jgi:hypothetical protein
LIADNTDGDHGITQDVTLAAIQNIFSVWAKKGNKNWLYLSDDTVANCTCYFDLDNCAVGTSGAGAAGYIEDWGNGWCRCVILFTGTAAAHTFKIQTADADNDKSVVGDGSTKNTYIWGAQIEVRSMTRYATSYIPTAGGQATREDDFLRFKGDDGNLGGVGSEQQGSMACKFLIPQSDSIGHAIACLSDGSSANDNITLEINSSDYLDVNTRASGGNNGDVTDNADVTDGVIVAARITWKTDQLTLYRNGSSVGTPDTAVDIPDDLDRIQIGGDRSNGDELDGIMSDFKIFKKITTA